MIELAGFCGAVLGGVAYVPQIAHLVRQRCTAGISRPAFALWWVASSMVAAHAVALGDGVFIILGAVQVAATTVILIFSTVYKGAYCEAHLPAAAAAARPALLSSAGGVQVGRAASSSGAG